MKLRTMQNIETDLNGRTNFALCNLNQHAVKLRIMDVMELRNTVTANLMGRGNSRNMVIIKYLELSIQTLHQSFIFLRGSLQR